MRRGFSSDTGKTARKQRTINENVDKNETLKKRITMIEGKKRKLTRKGNHRNSS